MFSKETYSQRRNQLKNSLGKGLVLFLGNEESSINFADNWYHFRQDSTFLYYVGISRSGLCATINCETGEETLYGNDASMDEIVWTGNQPTVGELAEKSGLPQSAAAHQLSDDLSKFLQSGGQIHLLPPYRPEHTQKIQALTGWNPEQVRQNVSMELIHAVAQQRNIKTDEEVAEIEKAVVITGEMHLAAMKSAAPGMKEYEVVSKVVETALQHGGELAFPIILTKNGQTLHNHYHGNTISDGDMVLCDAGAETSMGYCGDMTRTLPAGRQFSAQQAEMYQIVLDAHNAAKAALKPGVPFKDIHLLACSELFEGLKAVGLTQGDTAEAISQGAHTMFFQCGLGHLMGLDVHDMENLGEQNVGYSSTITKSKEFGLKSLRLGKELEPGHVITVEPGIYIIPELIDSWKAEKKHESFINYDVLEQFRGFGGIRVEEDFHITATGADLLGKPVALTLAEVESVRAL